MIKTKKKVARGETLVNFILDKSGSMESVRSATISGFNEYLNTLKKDGNKYSFSLTLFDTIVQSLFINKDIKDIKDLDSESYNPNGGTSLYDAVCSTIRKITEKKGQKVINIIMTDGQENSSKEYTEKNMKELIKEREKSGNWTFVYLGANQDSYANAQKFGISEMNTSNFVANNAGVKRSMNVMASNTATFAMSAVASTDSFFSTINQHDLQNVGATSSPEDKISAHFSSLGKKSWEKRKGNLSK